MESRTELFEGALEDLAGDVLATTSTVADVWSLVSVVGTDRATVQLLVDTETARRLRNSFLLSSHIVDRLESGTLEIRAIETPSPFSTLLIGDRQVRSIASISPSVVTAADADAEEAFVETARETHHERWNAAESITLRTPAHSGLLEALAADLGEAVRDDVERMFETAAEGPVPDDVDPVRVALLAGAKNELQFYELGRWGEAENLASRAKFSREKQTLEEAGLVATEKIPTDVGRPRQRLVLADPTDEDPEALFEASREVLVG
jgi:hypothetical protein